MTLNVTNWSSFEREFESPYFPAADVLLIQETHLRPGHRKGKLCHFKGFSSKLAAARQTAKGGTTGGVAVLWNQCIANHPARVNREWATGIRLQFGLVTMDFGSFTVKQAMRT
jgi:hypothetical protein